MTLDELFSYTDTTKVFMQIYIRFQDLKSTIITIILH